MTSADSVLIPKERHLLTLACIRNVVCKSRRFSQNHPRGGRLNKFSEGAAGAIVRFFAPSFGKNATTDIVGFCAHVDANKCSVTNHMGIQELYPSHLLKVLLPEQLELRSAGPVETAYVNLVLVSLLGQSDGVSELIETGRSVRYLFAHSQTSFAYCDRHVVTDNLPRSPFPNQFFFAVRSPDLQNFVGSSRLITYGAQTARLE